MNRERFSDYVTREDIKGLKPKFGKSKMLVANAPTGCGKSWFVKNILYDIAWENGEKILMLVNRSDLREEFQLELENEHKDDVIAVMCYQSLESYWRENREYMSLKKYNYIISDESNYFFQDSVFNEYTQESWNTIVNADGTKLLLSATNGLLISFLDYYNYNYELVSMLSNYNYSNLT